MDAREAGQDPASRRIQSIRKPQLCLFYQLVAPAAAHKIEFQSQFCNSTHDILALESKPLRTMEARKSKTPESGHRLPCNLAPVYLLKTQFSYL